MTAAATDGFFAPMHRWFLAYLVPLIGAMAVAGRTSRPSVVLAIGLVIGVLAAVAWSTRAASDEEPLAGADLLDRISQYVDGKVHRYWLLFAVNGGASFVAKYLAEEEESTLPDLDVHHVALGAITFTILMTWDLWLWGWRMRDPGFAGKEAFSPAGRAIALTIGGLLVVGWRLAI